MINNFKKHSPVEETYKENNVNGKPAQLGRRGMSELEVGPRSCSEPTNWRKGKTVRTVTNCEGLKTSAKCLRNLPAGDPPKGNKFSPSMNYLGSHDFYSIPHSGHGVVD